jgi:hypothetical protein
MSKKQDSTSPVLSRNESLFNRDTIKASAIDRDASWTDTVQKRSVPATATIQSTPSRTSTIRQQNPTTKIFAAVGSQATVASEEDVVKDFDGMSFESSTMSRSGHTELFTDIFYPSLSTVSQRNILINKKQIRRKNHTEEGGDDEYIDSTTTHRRAEYCESARYHL